MIRNTTRNQKLGWVLFIAYLTLLVYFMFFAESFGRNPDLREYSYNLELFKEIRRFYKNRKKSYASSFSHFQSVFRRNSLPAMMSKAKK